MEEEGIIYEETIKRVYEMQEEPVVILSSTKVVDNNEHQSLFEAQGINSKDGLF